MKERNIIPVSYTHLSLTAGTTITAYNAASISTLNVNKTNNLSLTVSDGAQPSAVYMENGTTTITNTGTTSPVVNVTTSGGIVKSEKTGYVYATVNVTATDALVAGDTATLNGAFSTVIHNGAGTVYMETKETTIDNIVQNSTGDVKTYGSIGSETDHDGAQSLSLIHI